MLTAKRSNSGTGTGTERSTFAMTCNRLSLFLKEKGNIRDFGINANFDAKGKPVPATETNKTTVDLLSKIECSVQTSEISQKTENLNNNLPQHVSLESFCKQNDSPNECVSGELVAPMESKTAEMTIFYRGKIFVFDNVSADRARDIMLAATGASSNVTYEAFRSRDQIVGRQVKGLDLPIARRGSLHKFLEKRRERATEIAPYQLPNRLTAVASINHKFDLNL